MNPEPGVNRTLLLSVVATASAAAALFASAGLMASPTGKNKPPAPASATAALKAARPLTEDERIVHVLNRLGYGPRPGDVEKVRAMGLSRYVALQISPERIDDAAVEKQLSAFAELQLSPEQLAAQYRELMTAGLQEKAMRKKQQKRNPATPASPAPSTSPAGSVLPAAPAATPSATADPNADPDAAMRLRRKARQARTMDPDTRREMRSMRQEVARVAAPVARANEEFMAAKMLRAIESERQLQEVLVDFWGNHFNIDIRTPPCRVLKIVDDRDAIRPHVLGKFRDLLAASAKSPAMLVYLDNYQSMSENGPARPAGRRPANRARRRALAQGGPAGASAVPSNGGAATPQTSGASAQPKGGGPSSGVAADPATNGVASVPPKNGGLPIPPKVKKRRPTGLNENYAREIMELHTLGVDGGYTQQDVREVARCFTGWTVLAAGRRMPGVSRYAAGDFQFNAAMHDNGEKTVLGHVIPAGGGVQDGEKVLDILAAHPATMRHISLQLCQRLVADEPPTSLIDKCVATWKRTDGDLREIVRTIVTSPEFYSLAAVRSKIKSPFEYAVSSVRALGGSYETAVAVSHASLPQRAAALIKPPKGGGYFDLNTTSLVGQVGTMGQPLFQYQAPTGYPEDSRKWVSSGALIARLNFALALTGGKLSDVKLQSANTAVPTDPDKIIDQSAQQILHTSLSPATRATLRKQVRLVSEDPGAATGPLSGSHIAALLLGSPEFQRH